MGLDRNNTQTRKGAAYCATRNGRVMFSGGRSLGLVLVFGSVRVHDCQPANFSSSFQQHAFISIIWQTLLPCKIYIITIIHNLVNEIDDARLRQKTVTANNIYIYIYIHMCLKIIFPVVCGL